MAHEKGHRDLAVAAAEDLTRAVADLSKAGTCTELDRKVHDLCRARMDRLLVEQRDYDTATHHGASQGAVFP